MGKVFKGFAKIFGGGKDKKKDNKNITPDPVVKKRFADARGYGRNRSLLSGEMDEANTSQTLLGG
tara:strand:+ start:164 stop:358 length:195 start_codon:yes stop_codon:yes gene_type:complete